MSSILRSVPKHAFAVSRSIRALPSTARSFHSPFAVLDTSPLTSSPPPPASFYQKEGDETVYDAFTNSKTYVVCQPDPSNTFHEVPSGAYPTSAPYVNWDATEAPEAASQSYSSTSSTPYAHPITRSAPRNPSGVGESAAVRNATAPGSMGMRGGGFGGLALMDKAGTQPGDGELASRNPQPMGKLPRSSPN